jgi:hypothetical protein
MLTHDISSHGLWPGELKKKEAKKQKNKTKTNMHVILEWLFKEMCCF